LLHCVCFNQSVFIICTGSHITGGQEGLYNLDIVAHQALISEEDFEEDVIAPMASRLTNRLVDVLRRLIDHQETHDTLKVLKPQLAHIMRLAIRIRSLSLVSTKVLETIWPSPGISFDEIDMATESPMDAKGSDVVRLPVLPGLRAYHNEKGMVRYHGFGGRVPKYSAPEYTTKAMVLV